MNIKSHPRTLQFDAMPRLMILLMSSRQRADVTFPWFMHWIRSMQSPSRNWICYTESPMPVRSAQNTDGISTNSWSWCGKSWTFDESTPNQRANNLIIRHLSCWEVRHARWKISYVAPYLPIIELKADAVFLQCNAIHKTIVDQFKIAIVYGRSVKHQPQRVGLSHELGDEDISSSTPVSLFCVCLTNLRVW